MEKLIYVCTISSKYLLGIELLSCLFDLPVCSTLIPAKKQDFASKICIMDVKKLIAVLLKIVPLQLMHFCILFC